MFNTFRNAVRKADNLGDVHFVSFLSSILSRLAYFNDEKFLPKYTAIMGPVVQPEILKAIDSVNPTELDKLLDDQTLYGLNDPNSKFKNYCDTFKEKKYINFLALNMPQNVNIINGEINGTPTVGTSNYPVQGAPPAPTDVKYISIATSNYGEIFVVADKRMPNTIFLLFRGTYSAKTASIYTKLTAIVPLTAYVSEGNKQQFLYGIYKVSIEMIHTIIETIHYLATDFLGATQPNSVKIFTTGHSLGGALCTDFAYAWMGIKQLAPYNTAPYNVVSDNIICISLGAPRGMSSSVAKKFCEFVEQKKILYLRITTRGDPVPALPPKIPESMLKYLGIPKDFSYQHPCSQNPEMRKVISEDCNAQLTMRPTPNVNYKGDLDCQNYKTRIYFPNPLSHTVYLDILFTSAVDIVKFFKGMVLSKEILRTPTKSTVCRLIMGYNGAYSAVFFDVNLARAKPSNDDAILSAELEQKPVGNPLEDIQATAPPTNPETTPVPAKKQSFFSSIKSKGSSWFGSKPVAAAPVANGPKKSFFSSPSKFQMFSAATRIGGDGSVVATNAPSKKKDIPQDVRVTTEVYKKMIQAMVPLNQTTGLDPKEHPSGQNAMFTDFGQTLLPILPKKPEGGISLESAIGYAAATARAMGGRLKKTKKLKKNKKTMTKKVRKTKRNMRKARNAKKSKTYKH
jgi:hypothetical protein